MTDGDTRLDTLAAAARQAAEGMGRAAGGKPDATPLTSDAKTFRGIVAMLTGLSHEARRRDEQVAALTRKLTRIANLEVRGAGELIERGDWRRIAGELQAIAQEAVGAEAGHAVGRQQSPAAPPSRAP